MYQLLFCGIVVTDFVGPQLPEGTGPHRYFNLMLPQPSSFLPPASLTNSNLGLSFYSHITDSVSISHLNQRMEGMYFDVQQGPSNITVPPTCAMQHLVSIMSAT